jgi:hypothetical protein
LGGNATVERVRLSDDGLNTFSFGDGNGAASDQLSWRGGVAVHTSLRGGHLYVMGNPTNESIGIWDYDVSSHSLNCLVPLREQAFKQARYVTPQWGETTDHFNRPVGYSLWPPRGLVAGKKYPLIIGQTVNGETLGYQQVVANSGCFFAMANRPYWLGKKLLDWPADVSALFQLMARNPNVDTQRVFLWGRSAETSFLGRLLEEQPQSWSGVILFDPSGLPDVKKLRVSKMLIITGRDAGNARRLVDYQAQAARAGISVKLILQDRTGHYPPSVRSMNERIADFAQYLNDDL